MYYLDYKEIEFLITEFNNKQVLEKILSYTCKGSRYSLAVKVVKKLLELFPDNYKFWKVMGDAFNKRKNLDKALFCYKQYLEKKPNSDRVWKKIGNIYIENEEFSDAIDTFEKVIKINPIISNYHSLAEFYLGMKDYPNALKLFEFITNKEDHLYNWEQLASLYTLMGQINNAIDAHLTAYNNTKGNYIQKAYNAKKVSLLYAKQNNYDNAFVLLLSFVRDYPQMAILSDFIGLLPHFRGKRFKRLRKCLEWFQKHRDFTDMPTQSELEKLGWFKLLDKYF